MPPTHSSSLHHRPSASIIASTSCNTIRPPHRHLRPAAAAAAAVLRLRPRRRPAAAAAAVKGNVGPGRNGKAGIGWKAVALRAVLPVPYGLSRHTGKGFLQDHGG